MKNLPLGIQTFSKLINGDYLYVDKTQYIYNLIADGGEYFFLSRPRRFGKSVLISTLAEMFAGNKELFKDLWIYDKIQWTPFPVIHIDFSTIDFESPENLKESLKKFLAEKALAFGITLDNKKSYKESFVALIEKLSHTGRVVILIDEYDKPVIEFLEQGKIVEAQQIRIVLKNFYGVIKAMDRYLRFVFITGVSKFSKVSVFSDLNNLSDITLVDRFSAILGYTDAELRHYFAPYMDQMAQKRGVSCNELIELIRQWYNGYSWDGQNFVYNPFSILNLFKNNSFENFWFATGTPGFLLKTMKDHQSELMEFENLSVDNYTFESYDLENLDIISLLFQTGYLTIKRITVEDEVKTYDLSYPNREVRESFLTHILGEYTATGLRAGAKILKRMNKAILADDPGRFIQEIKTLFASIPYHIFIGEKEAYYHSIIYIILRLNGAAVICEDPTNIGRIDATVETGSKIYILEFKMGSAAEALKQMKEMKYYEKFMGSGKKIVLMGIGFDPNKRNIDDYLVEDI